MPRPRARRRVTAGVYWNARRESYYLRFRATVYDDQVDRNSRPARRVVHSVKNVHRGSSTPGDWEASLREAVELRAEIEAELAELLGDLPGSSGLGIWKAPFEIDAEHPFVSVVKEASGEQLGGLFYWAETALFEAAGIPAVLLGPSGAGAHAEVEWVDIDSIHRCFEHYVAASRAFCA